MSNAVTAMESYHRGKTVKDRGNALQILFTIHVLPQGAEGRDIRHVKEYVVGMKGGMWSLYRYYHDNHRGMPL
jgi:hypothetical protein